MGILLSALTSSSGANSLARVLGSVSPQDTSRLKALVERVLAKRQDLGGVQVQPSPGMGENASFNHAKNLLSTGSSNPDYMAHELGHAENTVGNDAYRKLLTVTRGLLALSDRASIPLMLGLRAFASPQKRQDVLNTLAGFHASMAAPGLMEEASATANAIINSDDKIKTLAALAPAFGSHAIHDLLPILAYQVDRRL